MVRSYLKYSIATGIVAMLLFLAGRAFLTKYSVVRKSDVEKAKELERQNVEFLTSQLKPGKITDEGRDAERKLAALLILQEIYRTTECPETKKAAKKVILELLGGKEGDKEPNPRESDKDA